MKRITSLILVLTSLMSFAQPDSYTIKQSYEVKSPAEFSLSAVDGDLKVIGEEVSEIELYYIVKMHDEIQDMNMDDLKEYFNIEINESDNGLSVSAKPTVKNRSLDWKKRYNLNFYVIAPKKTACNLNTVDGDISVNTFLANQKYKTVDGDIRYSKIIGNVYAKTVDGDIDASKLKGNSEIKTIDGDVDIKGVIGNIKAKTVDGDIEITVGKGAMDLGTTDGDIKMEIPALEFPVKANAIDGDIELSVPKGSSFNIDMKGEDLKGNLKNFDGTVDDNFISGKINGGGVEVELRTSDGDISLSFVE